MIILNRNWFWTLALVPGFANQVIKINVESDGSYKNVQFSLIEYNHRE